MKSTNDLQNKQVLVLGYAMTGKSVVEFLLKAGANIVLNDRGDLSSDPSVSFLISEGVEVVDGGHPLSLLDRPLDFIVKNPGIPYQIPILESAIEQGIPIYTDIELASRYASAPIIGITGSNGKTTTTALIYDILKAAHPAQVHLAGNIGIPTLDIVQTASARDIIVMEVSSFQLEGTAQFHPQIAVLTNIYEAHLDYHGSRVAYVQAKMKLVANQTAEDVVIYNYDQTELTEFLSESRAVKIPFAIDAVDDYVRQHGVYLENEAIYARGERLFDIQVIQIPGQHNIQNVLAATAVALIEEVPLATLVEAVHNYQGMPHRIQPMGEYAGVRYYNDSKATNETATITALDSFDSSIVYIGGGLDRGVTFEALIPHLTQVKVAALYGEAQDKMAAAFKVAGVPTIEQFEELQEATTFAVSQAEPGDTVLFSPSCASWDQFENYERRGEDFIQFVQSLHGRTEK